MHIGNSSCSLSNAKLGLQSRARVRAYQAMLVAFTPQLALPHLQPRRAVELDRQLALQETMESQQEMKESRADTNTGVWFASACSTISSMFCYMCRK